MGLPFALAVERIQVGNNPPLEIKVIRGIGLLHRHKEAEQDGLSSSFFEHDGKMLASWLAKLLGSFWSGKQTRKDWCGSVFASIDKKDKRSQWVNDRGISVVSTGSKLPMTLYLAEYLLLSKGVCMKMKLVFDPVRVISTKSSLGIKS